MPSPCAWLFFFLMFPLLGPPYSACLTKQNVSSQEA